MASNNKLLGAGKVEGFEDTEILTENFSPIWMYREDCMTGKIVRTSKDLQEKLDAEWKDHPGKCVKLAGHEGVFEKELEDFEAALGTPEEEEEKKPEKPVADKPKSAKSKSGK